MKTIKILGLPALGYSIALYFMVQTTISLLNFLLYLAVISGGPLS